jgi:hypothetical protein
MSEQQLTMTEKINLPTSEIGKIVKKELKKRYPECKFSVSSEYYSMGSSLYVCLMSANFKVTKTFEEIPQDIIQFYINNGYTIEQLKTMCNRNYFQLNPNTLREDYNGDYWNNATFLTKKAHDMLADVVKLTDKYNWNHSDSQSDYYDVHFSLNVHIGKWDKPFIETKED